MNPLNSGMVPIGNNIHQMRNLPPGMGLPPNPQMISMGSAFQPNPTDILAKKKEFLK